MSYYLRHWYLHGLRRLPSRMTGISRATLRRRLASLERDGYTERLRGFCTQAQLSGAIEADAQSHQI